MLSGEVHEAEHDLVLGGEAVLFGVGAAEPAVLVEVVKGTVALFLILYKVLMCIEPQIEECSSLCAFLLSARIGPLNLPFQAAFHVLRVHLQFLFEVYGGQAKIQEAILLRFGALVLPILEFNVESRDVVVRRPIQQVIVDFQLRVRIDECLFFIQIFKVFKWLILVIPRIEQILRLVVAETVQSLEVQLINHFVIVLHLFLRLAAELFISLR